jgi:hypothetical protein
MCQVSFGAARAKTFPWRRRVNASSWSLPSSISDEPVPARRRGEDPADALGKDRETPSRNVAVVFGEDHLVDRSDLLRRELLRRPRRALVDFFELAGQAFTLPGVIAGLGEADQAENSPQRKGRPGTIDGA